MSHITQKPLFDEAEKQRIDQVLLQMQAKAEAAIERAPEKRDEILQRLHQASTQYVQKEVRFKRMGAVFVGLMMIAVGILILSVTDAKEGFGLKVGGSALISGIVTALIAVFQLLGD